MSNAWDLNKIRKIAGLPPAEPAQLNESYDDDDYGDDEDPDVKIASEDKGQKAFERKNKKELKAADKEAKDLKKKPAPAAEKKAEPKKAEPKKEDGDTFVHGKGFVKKSEAEAAKKEVEAKKSEEKKPAEGEAKRRGKAPSDSSKQGQARSWLTSTAGHTRKAFIAHATSKLGMSAAHANAFYYAHKKKSAAEPVKEAWVLVHPFMKSYLLAENREMNQMQWVDTTVSSLDPLVFETEDEAKKIQKYMAEWKGQSTILEHVTLEDEE